MFDSPVVTSAKAGHPTSLEAITFRCPRPTNRAAGPKVVEMPRPAVIEPGPTEDTTKPTFCGQTLAFIENHSSFQTHERHALFRGSSM